MFERGFTDRNKLITVSLILLLLLSTFVAVSHHHENTADDHDCPICIANNHQSAAGPLLVAFDGTPCLTETIFVASAPVRTAALFIFSRSTRGPPA
jgi:hypothetical protein